MSHVKVVMIGTRDNLQKIYDSVGDSSAETSAELAFGYDYLDNNVDFYSFRESRAFNSVELKWTKNDAEYQHLLDEIKDPIRCPDIIDIRCAPDFINVEFDYINKRLIKHLSQINCKNVCSALYSAFAKYGKDNFFIESIITGEYSKDELNELEIFYIKKFNSLAPNGYNLQSGGNSFMVVESVKKQISNTLKGRKITWNKKIGEEIRLIID